MSEEHQVTPEPSDNASAVVDKLFNDRVPGSILARDVDVYNYVRAIFDELKERLKSRG